MVDFSQVTDVVIPEGVVTKIEAGGDILWEKVIEPEIKGLKFTAKANSTLGYTVNGSLPNIQIQYSFDGINWVNWNGETLNLVTNDVIYIRNKYNYLSESSSNYFYFTMSGRLNASGNIYSMVNYSSSSNYCFYYLFKNCSALRTPPDIDDKIIVYNYSFAYMFYKSGITEAPDLDSYISFRDYTCLGMFYQCTNLDTVGKISANTLGESCFESMFYGCSSLSSVGEINIQFIDDYCCKEMFRGCSDLEVSEGSGRYILIQVPPLIGKTDPFLNMFYDTGGSFTGTPTENKIYYRS